MIIHYEVEYDIHTGYLRNINNTLSNNAIRQNRLRETGSTKHVEILCAFLLDRKEINGNEQQEHECYNGTMKPLVTRRILKEYPLTLNKIADRFVAIDFETDGRDCENGRVIEIGACFFENGQPVKTFSSLVHSVDYLPPFITELTGITIDMVRNAPAEPGVWKRFVEFLDGALEGQEIIVAHNAAFDTSFLKTSLERLGYSGTIRYLDTVDLSQKLLPYMSGHALNKVCAELQIELENHHRALDDAVACGNILATLMNDEDSLKKYTKRAVQKLSKQEIEIASAIFSMQEADWGILRHSNAVVTLYVKGLPVFSFVARSSKFYFLADADLLEYYPWAWTFANQKECEYGLFRIPIDTIDQLGYFRPYVIKKIKQAMETPFEDAGRHNEWKYGIAKQTYKKIKPHIHEVALSSTYSKRKGRPVRFARQLACEENRLFDRIDYEHGLVYKFYLTRAIDARKQHQYELAHTFLRQAYRNGLRTAEMFVEIANFYKHHHKPEKEVEWLLKGAQCMNAINLVKERQLLLLRAAKLMDRQNSENKSDRK